MNSCMFPQTSNRTEWWAYNRYYSGEYRPVTNRDFQMYEMYESSTRGKHGRYGPSGQEAKLKAQNETGQIGYGIFPTFRDPVCESVGQAKITAGTYDKYLICWINSQRFNNKPSLVFKSSRQIGELAIGINCSSKKSPLVDNFFFILIGHTLDQGDL